MRIFKSWFNQFFLCSGMRIEFLLSTGINLYSFGHEERVCLFSSKMRAKNLKCMDVHTHFITVC